MKERTCVWCGARFGRRPTESQFHFEQRKTCSEPCRGQVARHTRFTNKLRTAWANSREPGEVPLFNGGYAYVDPEDFERVMQHIWKRKPAPDSDRVYAVAHINGKETRLHRFVLNARPGTVIDHVDRDGLNNRRCNLRFATDSQNAMNRKTPTGTVSRFKGVTPFGDRWRVRVKQRHIGLFESEEEAARAYDRVAREVFGEFARTNFPD